MAKASFRRETKGIDAFLKSAAVADVIYEVAHDVAVDVEQSLPARPRRGVVVDDYTSKDRAVSSVTIRDGRAKAWQAKTGVLTKAAKSAGLEVRERVR